MPHKIITLQAAQLLVQQLFDFAVYSENTHFHFHFDAMADGSILFELHGRRFQVVVSEAPDDDDGDFAPEEEPS